MTSKEVIELLDLKPLPQEGGFFKETFRSEGKLRAGVLSPTSASRSYYSCIYYLITPETFSSLHRLSHDEIFHFYLGDPVQQVELKPSGELKRTILGLELQKGHVLQNRVLAYHWQGARLLPGGSWALLGTTMAPGFEWNDFEPGISKQLISQFPEHETVIREHTHES